MSRPLSRRALALQRLAVLVALAILLAPIAWLIAVGYRPASEVFSFPPRLVTRLTLENFRAIFALFDVPRLVWSSIAISGGSTLLALLLGVPAGYALARSGLSWAPRLAYLFLAVRMVPPVATLIPFYLMMRDIGLLGSYGAVILIDAMQSPISAACRGRSRMPRSPKAAASSAPSCASRCRWSPPAWSPARCSA